MMRVRMYGLVMLGVLVVLAAGCGGGTAPATVEPTQPPTAIPTIEPGNANPGAAETVAALPTLGPGIFTDALAKAKQATTYRVEMTMAGSGLFNPANAATASDATVTPIAAQANTQLSPLVAMQGDVKGSDQHLTIKGAMAAFLGVSPDKGLEVITVGGKSFLRGPAGMLGAPEDKWYLVPAEQAGIVQPPVEPGNVFDAFSQTGLNPNDFKAAGTETLDGQACSVYVGDKDVTVKAFQELNKSSASANSGQYDIDAADFRFWVCPDGTLRQAKLAIDAHTHDKPDQKGSFLLSVHIFDVNGSIVIQAPAESEPLKPSPLQPTVAPTK